MHNIGSYGMNNFGNYGNPNNKNNKNISNQSGSQTGETSFLNKDIINGFKNKTEKVASTNKPKPAQPNAREYTVWELTKAFIKSLLPESAPEPVHREPTTPSR